MAAFCEANGWIYLSIWQGIGTLLVCLQPSHTSFVVSLEITAAVRNAYVQDAMEAARTHSPMFLDAAISPK